MMDIHQDLLLPPKISNKQVCMLCLNYLSVGPVMITNDDKTICGRCVPKYAGLKMSLYNLIAEECVFTCINRYDGCNNMSKFSETLQHELVCSGTVYNCPFCPFKGNGCQFKQHCDAEHTEQVVREGVFKISTTSNLCDSEEDLIYFDVDKIFLIKIILKQDTLKVSSTILNIINGDTEINKYHLRFFKPNSKIEYVSEPIEFQLGTDTFPRNCFKINVTELLDIFSTSIHCLFILNVKASAATLLETKDYNMKQKYLSLEKKIKAREQLVKNEEQEIMLKKQSLALPYNVIKTVITLFHRASINCANCSMLIKDIYHISICPQSHISCADCLNKFCKVCGTDCDWMTCKDVLQGVALTCDWKNCGVNLKVPEYLPHKQICNFRRYKCPLKNCTFDGTQLELLAHWHDSKTPLKIGKTVDFTVQSSCEIYWIIDRLQELLHVKLTKQPNQYSSFDIYENGSIFPNNYTIQLHYYDQSSQRYVLYNTLKQLGNRRQITYQYLLNCRLIVKYN